MDRANELSRTSAHRHAGCRGILVFFLSGLAFVRADAAVPTPRMGIVSNGASPYVIVVPDAADEARIMPAATLLQSSIRTAAGATLPIVKESSLPKGAPAFHLGKTQAARQAALPVDAVTGWGYLNQAVGRDIFIVGDDARDAVADRGEIGHQGTLKGVTAFLERELGVRFLVPGEYGVRIPTQAVLTVDAVMKTAWQPEFDYVIGGRASRDKVLAVALNLFGQTPVLKSYGGHSYYSAVPEKEFGVAHPEYFALRGGIRTPKGNHLCISNPDVQELMLKEMERQLDKGYQWVELAQTDGYEACQCESCAALHPDEAERIWIVHRKLAEAMKTRRPGKKVMILSYAMTATPPKSFTTFPDNVVIQLCTYTPESFERWASFNVDKTVYLYNWGTYKLPGLGPTRTPRYAVDQIRRFRANRVRGIYLCGGCYDGPVGCGLNGPAFYAFGKALEDPALEARDAQEDYVNALFGEAAVPMRAFYRSLYERLETYSLFDCPNARVDGVPNTMKTPEDFYCHCFPPKLLNDLALNLERARAIARDERVKAALTMVELEFAYVRNVASVFHAYRAYRVSPNAVRFDELARAADERNRGLDTLFGANGTCSVKLPGGLPLCFAALKRKDAEMNGRVMGLRPPFNWDFADLKARGILPGAGQARRLEVRRVGAFTLDGDIDKAVWRDVPFQALGEMGLGKAPNATRFKAAYDDQAFYLAVECEFDATEWIDRLKPVGRDGAAWAQECIELGIDPYGQREKHCQLVFSPIADAAFDARRGYIDDPLHPLFAKPDIAWNGQWDYVARIDRDRKRWTAEVRIPFKTLDADPPVSGTMWTMNVGRSEWPVEHAKGGGARYSTWSPNLESRDFHDRASFSEVVFQ